MIIELLKTILLGIVEGITEWLPISSTGHMILFDEFIKLNVSDAFKEMFFVVIQLGAILAVIVLYFNKLNPFSAKKSKDEKKNTYILWSKIIVACIPAGIIGFLFDDFLDEHFYNFITVALMLIIYGIIFIIVEAANKKRTPVVTDIDKLSFKRAFMIGMFQVLALIPGTSRSGATIVGGLIIGVSREVAAEFTFFLAIPVMFGASVLKMVKMVLKTGMLMTASESAVLIVGVVTAFIVSVLAIKFLMRYIKKNDFSIFGYYRIVLGVVLVIYFLLTL